LSKKALQENQDTLSGFEIQAGALNAAKLAGGDLSRKESPSVEIASKSGNPCVKPTDAKGLSSPRSAPASHSGS
jgi:hypothetical protein